MRRRAREKSNIELVSHYEPEERRRCYSQHLGNVAVDHRGGAAGNGLSAQVRLPIGIADDDLRNLADSFVLWFDQAALPRSDTENIEELSAHFEAMDALHVRHPAFEHIGGAP